jgi:ElaB/YqjD/DUF883 family membrane-anchored ribosome-binding protein
MDMDPTNMSTDPTSQPVPANGVGSTAARAVGDASSKAHGAIDRMSAGAVPVLDRATSGAHRAVDSVASAASGAVETLAAQSGQFQAGQARVAEECRGYVRENPLASVGIALAAGFLLSRLLGSR